MFSDFQAYEFEPLIIKIYADEINNFLEKIGSEFYSEFFLRWCKNEFYSDFSIRIKRFEENTRNVFELLVEHRSLCDIRETKSLSTVEN